MSYAKIIEGLKNKGVNLEEGLSEEELKYAERRYGILFPPDLREFLQAVLPVSDDACNWRDTSAENERNLSSRLHAPLEAAYFDFENNDFWWPDWGTKPARLEEAKNVIAEKFKLLPRMIPVFSHRCIPSVPHEAGNPVFSVWQMVDTIYWADNLVDFLSVEAGLKERKVNSKTLKHIPFWTDLVEEFRGEKKR
jgi:hypothetical protein